MVIDLLRTKHASLSTNRQIADKFIYKNFLS